MQTPEGIKKMRETMIKKYGSEEAYREHLRTLGTKGGAAPYKGKKGFAAHPGTASAAGKKSAITRGSKE